MTNKYFLSEQVEQLYHSLYQVFLEAFLFLSKSNVDSYSQESTFFLNFHILYNITISMGGKLKV